MTVTVITRRKGERRARDSIINVALFNDQLTELRDIDSSNRGSEGVKWVKSV